MCGNRWTVSPCLRSLCQAAGCSFIFNRHVHPFKIFSSCRKSITEDPCEATCSIMNCSLVKYILPSIYSNMATMSAKLFVASIANIFLSILARVLVAVTVCAVVDSRDLNVWNLMKSLWICSSHNNTCFLCSSTDSEHPEFVAERQQDVRPLFCVEALMMFH